MRPKDTDFLLVLLQIDALTHSRKKTIHQLNMDDFVQLEQMETVTIV